MWNSHGHDGWLGMDGIGWAPGMGLHGVFGLVFVLLLAAALILLVR